MSAGLSLSGKVVLVTGACSTVGAELAKYFSKLGSSLVLTDCDKYRLNKVSEECTGNSVVKIAADLSKNEDVSSVIKQTVDQFKKLDVLIGCVGPVDGYSDGGQTSSDGFKIMMDVNVCSMHSLTQSAYPHLVKTNGCVVIVHGRLSHSEANDVSYKVSTSALDELTRSLASRYACEGVRVNAVRDSFIGNQLENPGKHPEKTVGLKRGHSAPEDIAAAVVFLASDLAIFISGAVLPVGVGIHCANVNERSTHSEDSNKERPSKVDSRSNELKSEQYHDAVTKGEHSHPERTVLEQPKRDTHKEEHPSKSPSKQETRKVEAEKPATVKHPSTDKISKPATKNHSN